MLIVPIALLCVSSSFRQTAHQRRIRITGFVTLAIGAITFVLVHLFVQSTNSYTFITAAKYWLETKSLLQLAAALFLAFGPMLAVIAAFPTSALRFWNAHREVPAVVVICLLLGVVGGTNTEVFLYWSAPCILVTVGHLASRVLASRIGVLALTLAAAFQLIAQRAFMQFPLVVEADSIPFVFLAPLGDAAYLQLWSQFAQPEILYGVVLSNLVVSLFLVVVLRVSTRSTRRPEFGAKMVSAGTGRTY